MRPGPLTVRVQVDEMRLTVGALLLIGALSVAYAVAAWLDWLPR